MLFALSYIDTSTMPPVLTFLIWGRPSASGVSSDWMMYERGIFAGCTISVVLFVAAFNVILEYVDVGEIERYKMSNGNTIELLRGFMDDVSILARSVGG